MKRNREFAATPIPPLKLVLVHTKTFSCQKSFVTRSIKILRGNRGGGVILVPFHCKKIKSKPIRKRAKCQLYFVPDRICWDKIKLTAEVPKVDSNIRSGIQREKGLPQRNPRGKRVSCSGIQGENVHRRGIQGGQVPRSGIQAGNGSPQRNPSGKRVSRSGIQGKGLSAAESNGKNV